MSYRQSLYPGASLSSSSATPSASAISNLSDKQRQVLHFHQIHQHSQNLCQLYQSYADKYNVLVGGSECTSTYLLLSLVASNRSISFVRSTAVGDVVEHWQNVFRSTSLALGESETRTTCLRKRYSIELCLRFAGSIQHQKQALSTPGTPTQDVQLQKGTLPDQLVRIPVKPDQELQPDEAGSE